MQEHPIAPVVGDEPASPVPEALDPNLVRELSELRPAVSSLRIALEWLSIFAAAALCGVAWSSTSSVALQAAIYVLCVAFIGARQHGLLVLAHDAAHYRLFRNRAWNDWIGELFLAWPFVLLTMRAYRRNHFPHHRHVNTDRDPDWVRKQTPEWKFPKSKADLARMLFAYVTGIGFVRFIAIASKLPKQPADKSSKEDLRFARMRVVFLLGVVASITVLHAWRPVLLFWIVPYLTWLQLCLHVRSVAEHFAIQNRSGVFAQSRTVLASGLDVLLLVPNNVGYHIEHHLYPSVPFYRLPELHRLLMAQPVYKSSAHITHGYFGVLRECATPPATEPVQHDHRRS